MIKILLLFTLVIPLLVVAQENENENENKKGVGPGISTAIGESPGFNLRFHYFPNHKMCFGIESNIFPKQGEKITENMEITFNGHYIFKLTEHWGIYPILGAGWKNTKHESGWRALTGGGFHGSYGRFGPYIEYIYSTGFESEGILLIGTFFTFHFKKKEKRKKNG